MSDDLIPPLHSGITPENWQQTPASVRVWVTALGAEIKQLKETVEKLQEIVKRNSQNSSQPPSQDRPEQKTVKEKASQPRHRGHHRMLAAQPDEVIVHKPVGCARCGALLLGENSKPYRYQVTELPVVKARVVEHQVHRLTCPCCGLVNRRELPRDVAASQFGVNVMSLVGLLMGRYRLSKRQVAQLLRECFGIEMAASTVVNHQTVLSQSRQPGGPRAAGRELHRRGGDAYPIGWHLKLQAEYLLVLWARVRDGTLSYADPDSAISRVRQVCLTGHGRRLAVRERSELKARTSCAGEAAPLRATRVTPARDRAPAQRLSLAQSGFPG